LAFVERLAAFGGYLYVLLYENDYSSFYYYYYYPKSGVKGNL